MFDDLRINKWLNLTLYQKHLTCKLCPGVKKRLTPFPLFAWSHFGIILCFLGCLHVLFITDCCNYWRFGSWRIWGSIQVTNKQTNGQSPHETRQGHYTESGQPNKKQITEKLFPDHRTVWPNITIQPNFYYIRDMVSCQGALQLGVLYWSCDCRSL